MTFCQFFLNKINLSSTSYSLQLRTSVSSNRNRNTRFELELYRISRHVLDCHIILFSSISHTHTHTRGIPHTCIHDIMYISILLFRQNTGRDLSKPYRSSINRGYVGTFLIPFRYREYPSHTFWLPLGKLLVTYSL